MEFYKSLVIVIPVINERTNLEVLIPKIRLISEFISIYIIDDGSEDRTREFVELTQSNFKNIFYVNRLKRLGLGSAHVEGLNFAIDNNYEFCITMDGDQTHDPYYIPIIFQLLNSENTDLVLTSRFIEGGGLINWNKSRTVITYLGHFLTSIFIRSKMDLTSGMRGYRCKKIPKEMLKTLKTSQYEFLPLSFIFYKKSKLKILEVPILLPNRFFGHSKINSSLIFRNVYSIIFFNRAINRLNRSSLE